MADIDILPKRGIPTKALVDGLGIASNGSATLAQLAARGMRGICAVDSTGNAITGGTLAQLAARGIEVFCSVDETGISLDATTADTLRKRGIQPMVLVDANGIAQNGSANMETLRKRSLGYFCPLDETGTATTMGAVVLLTNNTISTAFTIGQTVGVLSVVGGSGTYTYSLLSNPGGLFAISGSNLNVAAALTAGDKPITVRASGGVPTPVDRVFTITVTPPQALGITALVGAFPLTGEDMTPTAGWTLTAGAAAGATVFAFSGQSATLTPPTPPAAEVWNNSDKGTGIVLSGTPLLAVTFPAIAGTTIVRAVIGHSTGKYYFEYTITSTINSFTCCGIANAAHALNGEFLGGGTNSLSYVPSGSVFVNSAQFPGTPIASFTTGDTVGLAFDLTTQKLWARVGAGGWNNDILANQNPATATGGLDFVGRLAAGVVYFPAAFDSNPGSGLTANFGQTAYAHAAPSGFGNW